MIRMSPEIIIVLMNRKMKKIKKINAGQNTVHKVDHSSHMLVPY